ncbi:MAG: DUF3732 domain-containing protein [Erysipelotrichales bacterium]|nr:DUF3732 domain-containing protein [Erysipelotrichales bacterium]
MIKIKKVLLWSNDNELREVEFNANGITVLIGNSKSGKSNIISIIDYCLGSSDCQISAGPIRKSCSWFGIVLEIDRIDYIIARMSPKNLNNSHEMYKERLSNGEIPTIVKANTNRTEIKEFFNSYYKYTDLPIIENELDYIPNYRDTIGINFYTQEQLLNRDYYFYKQNIPMHNKNIKAIFPYILGLETFDNIVQQKFIENLRKELRKLNKEYQNNKSIKSRWEADCDVKLLRCIILNLANAKDIPNQFKDKIEFLKRIIDNKKVYLELIESNRKELNSRIIQLLQKRNELYKKIMDCNQKIRSIEKQEKGIHSYNEYLFSNNDQRKISEWMLQEYNENYKNGHDKYLESIFYDIYDLILKEEESIDFCNDFNVVLDKELENIKMDLNQNKYDLSLVEKSIKEINQNEISLQSTIDFSNEVFSFIGELKSYLEVYNIVFEESNIENEIKKLEDRIELENKKIDKKLYKEKFDNIVNYMNASLEHLLESLNVEYKADQVKFDLNDISFSFSLTKSGVNLTKIGSGANTVEYHIAMGLLIHSYIQNKVQEKCTFDFIVFDQPSEAYFPTEEENQEKILFKKKPNDILQLKKIYKTIAYYQKNYCKNMQIIILEHAGSECWLDSQGNYYTQNIKFIDWKKDNEKLVPQNWFE